jgi:hypothetical protein
MDKGVGFKNASKPWSQEEEAQLNKLYNEDKLDIIEISKMHDRAPGGIISRLVRNNYIDNRMSARGYETYKNSDLYKEIVANKIYKNKQEIPDDQYKKRNPTQLDNILISINKSDYTELQNNVKEMKNEIKELKHSIKELIEMMKAVYEFEDE